MTMRDIDRHLTYLLAYLEIIYLLEVSFSQRCMH